MKKSSKIPASTPHLARVPMKCIGTAVHPLPPGEVKNEPRQTSTARGGERPSPVGPLPPGEGARRRRAGEGRSEVNFI